MRKWIGTVLIAVAGAMVTVTTLVLDGVALWVPIVFGVLTVTGVALTFPLRKRREAAPAASAFIKGNAVGNRMHNVHSNAQVFVDGDAHDNLFSRVFHRAPSDHEGG